MSECRAMTIAEFEESLGWMEIDQIEQFTLKRAPGPRTLDGIKKRMKMVDFYFDFKPNGRIIGVKRINPPTN